MESNIDVLNLTGNSRLYSPQFGKEQMNTDGGMCGDSAYVFQITGVAEKSGSPTALSCPLPN